MEGDRGTGIWQTWEKLARCRMADPELFSPRAETDESLRKVNREFCDLCPVRLQCLSRALVNRDSGYFGGTSTVQRRAMSRTRTRTKCPVCKNVKVVRVQQSQICTCCGTSWRSDSPPATTLTPDRVTLPRQRSAEIVTVPDPGKVLS